MNAKKQKTVSLLLAQLNAELSGDADCEAILDKLMRRVSTLMMGEFDPTKFIAELGFLPDQISLEQLRKMTVANLGLLLKEQSKCMEKKAEYTERIDTHRDYVKALEDRCASLTREFLERGGDVSKYPPMEKL